MHPGDPVPSGSRAPGGAGACSPTWSRSPTSAPTRPRSTARARDLGRRHPVRGRRARLPLRHAVPGAAARSRPPGGSDRPARGRPRSTARPTWPACREVRERSPAGKVYQVNVCRVLSRGLGPRPTPWRSRPPRPAGNPAPYAGVLEHRRRAGRGHGLARAVPAAAGDRRRVRGPIKGTAPTAEQLLRQGRRRERDDRRPGAQRPVARVPSPARSRADALLEVQQHPGLVHLVSTVSARLRAGVGWGELIAAAGPPGFGVRSAQVHCAAGDLGAGAGPARALLRGLGWVDATTGDGELAVGHPHLLVVAGGRRRAAVRHRRRHHLGLGPASWSGTRRSSRRLVWSVWRLAGGLGWTP